MKNALGKLIVSILMCTLITSVILGISTYKNKVYDGNPLWAMYISFVYILIYSWWVFYVPAILSFQLTIKYIKSRIYLYYMVLGIFWGEIWCAVYLKFQPNFIEASWAAISKKDTGSTFLTFAIVGAIYGIVYRKWLMEKPNPDSI